ncbi:3954_t:CDS:1, partial [Scutellospora calospora]
LLLQVYLRLDLMSVYWQVCVKEEDREKTAFATSSDTYEFW